jgi:hypothetical protein
MRLHFFFLPSNGLVKTESYFANYPYFKIILNSNQNMSFIEQIEALERLHYLIKRKATGTPDQLAARFKVSVGTVKNLIKILKYKDLPIGYCRDAQTYYYECELEVQFFSVKIKREDAHKIQGGKTIFAFFSPRQNSCLGTAHLCNRLANNEFSDFAGNADFDFET